MAESKESIRLQARQKDGITQVKALIKHPMETGARKDRTTGELIPAHFIQSVQCHYRDTLVMDATWSGGVSKNPYFAFSFKGGEAGEEVSLSWTDNKGETDSVITNIR